jgi:hypothetical protein
MSAQPLVPPPVPPAPLPGRGTRVEYLDFRDVEKHREFRFRVYGADGSNEFRMRVANAAFDDHRVRMQDGPDLCYQKLLRAIAAGVTLDPGVTTIDDRDFFSYRDDHTVVRKRRSGTPPPPAEPVVEARRPPQYRPRTPRTVSPRLPVAPLVASDVEPTLEEGQRVNHAVFGMGVTTAASSARTAVSFDRDGPKSFVTSMLEVEVLSAPHTWETSPRGVNRPCRTVGKTAGSKVEESFDPLAPLRTS